MDKKGEILLYKTEDGKSQLEVLLEQETVWLNQSQVTELFQQTKQNVSLHINNIFKEKELDKKTVVKESLTTASDGKKYKVNLYNLDVIISIGYRVKSKRGTQFRIWATQTLKDHLVKGYTVNEKRLKEQQEKWKELQQTVEFLKRTVGKKELTNNETQGLLEIISQYTRSFVLLNKFDTESLETTSSDKKLTYEIKYKEAVTAIEELKRKLLEVHEASELFGRQRDDGFKSLLKSVIQTFDGEYLYPTIEEQAANLLYFTIKNHPFADGNKRIGAFLFIWFLQRNKYLLRKTNEAKINDNALVALALLVAQSDPSTKELMIKLIMNLISD
ncbi:virulence protein RhuM/Fic/DOC family protein [Terrimonas pollutisoli]|uniref:virulence protein RhuM/Fic/DOC family protein n=1 Tax=Terrimonas pollutisoli TaxID=3034147 RepID=UPI0023ECC772|nr:virulence protein RhuM/Fic/DOC family protein [Terrimonas sp. H1YJ31]